MHKSCVSRKMLKIFHLPDYTTLTQLILSETNWYYVLPEPDLQVVTKRGKQEYDGLLISIEPDQEKDFYLTGEEPLFWAVIENPAKRPRYGRIILIWRLVNYSNVRPIEFKLDQETTGRFEISKEFLIKEGIGNYELFPLSGHTEDYAQFQDDQLKIQIEDQMRRYRSIPLLSYYVKDKDIYAYEKSYRDETRINTQVTLEYTEAILKYTKYLLAFTIAMVLLALTSILPNLIPYISRLIHMLISKIHPSLLLFLFF